VVRIGRNDHGRLFLFFWFGHRCYVGPAREKQDANFFSGSVGR
jgi:hypothetical protein